MASVEKLENGRYKAHWRAPNGKSRSKTFLLARDAKNHLTAVSHARQTGTYVDPGAGKMLLGDYVERIFDQAMKGAPSSLVRDRSYIRNYILPTFGETQLIDIDYDMIQIWVNRMERNGKSPETVHKAVWLLGRIMKMAKKGKRVPSNPVEDIEMTAIGDHDAMFLDPPQVDTLADAMEYFEPRYRALIYVGCYCGPRIGELIALRWSDFDLGLTLVSIDKSTSEVQGHLSDGPTKTKAGRRKVPVPPIVAAELRRHREAFPPGPDDRVFTAPEGGPIRVNNLRRRAWADATLRAGLATATQVPRTKAGKPLMDQRSWKKGVQLTRRAVRGMTFHDMRHTAVAMWIAIGSNDLQVAKWAGHRSVSFTKDKYGHLFNTDPAAAMARLDALIQEGRDSASGKIIELRR